MEKIPSFTVNHLKLLPGVYVSRRDVSGDAHVTTFDIRMTRPNHEPVMNTAEIHTIEHLGATFLRNHKPGAAAKDCGNYLDMNLPMAKYLAKKFYDEVLENIQEEQLVYPVS